jgi:hypothetical protein
MLLAAVSFSTSLAFAATTTGVTTTYNGSLAANGLGSGGNWTEGSPFTLSGAGAYADLLFTGAETGSTFTPNPSLIAGKITWPRDPDALATFKLQVSDTLATGAWTDSVPPDASIGETNPNQIILTLPVDGPKRFARLVVNP